MRKRLAALAAALLLPALACGALAEGEGTIVQSSCNIVQSGEYYLVYCYAQVHNASDQIICLDRGTFELQNGDQLVASEEISQLWPYFLSPGEDGYLFDIVPFEPNEDGVVVPSITGIQYFPVFMTIEPQYAGVKLPCTARIERENGGLAVVCEVQNPTDTAAYDPSIAIGLYTEGGAMIYADGVVLQDVGIPAGGTTLVRFRVDDALVEQWEGYGAAPASAQAQALFRNDAD